jgi:hypothetical protein
MIPDELTGATTRSHTRTVQSSLPLTARVPCAVTATDHTQPG